MLDPNNPDDVRLAGKLVPFLIVLLVVLVLILIGL